MPFLMSMPTSPSVATMATNPNVLPESIMPKITPMKEQRQTQDDDGRFPVILEQGDEYRNHQDDGQRIVFEQVFHGFVAGALFAFPLHVVPFGQFDGCYLFRYGGAGVLDGCARYGDTLRPHGPVPRSGG